MKRILALVALGALAPALPASAQIATRPGPWAVDLRGATSPVPQDAVFYPALDGSALIPQRGFGVDAGAHVYLFNLGPARLGVGASVIYLRSTTSAPEPVSAPESEIPPPEGQDVRFSQRTVSPQVSFNFGSRNGWSYVSAGMGTVRVVTSTSGSLSGERESTGIRNVNVGGGARWFLKSHVAFTFDVRLHRWSSGTAEAMPTEPAVPESTPGKLLLTVGAGLSFR